MTESELGTHLGPGEPKKQEELKFTDYSINKFQSDFSSGRKKIRTKIDGDSDITEFDSNTFIIGEKQIVGIQRESGGTGNIHVWKDGSKLTPTSQQANPGEIVFSTLGTRNADRFFDGHMHEVLVYDTIDLTTSEIGKISNYLANKHTPLG